MGHDIKLQEENNPNELSDVDSLFTSDDIDFLVERKRTVGKDTVAQVLNTRHAYKHLMKTQGVQKKVVSVLYGVSVPEQYAQELLAAGVHVLQDSLEMRFCLNERD